MPFFVLKLMGFIAFVCFYVCYILRWGIEAGSHCGLELMTVFLLQPEC